MTRAAFEDVGFGAQRSGGPPRKSAPTVDCYSSGVWVPAACDEPPADTADHRIVVFERRVGASLTSCIGGHGPPRRVRTATPRR